MSVNGPATASSESVTVVTICPGWPARCERARTVARSAMPVTRRPSAFWNHESASSVLSPHRPSIWPGEKPARSSSVWSLTTLGPATSPPSGTRIGLDHAAAVSIWVSVSGLAWAAAACPVVSTSARSRPRPVYRWASSSAADGRPRPPVVVAASETDVVSGAGTESGVSAGAVSPRSSWQAARAKPKTRSRGRARMGRGQGKGSVQRFHFPNVRPRKPAHPLFTAARRRPRAAPPYPRGGGRLGPARLGVEAG